MANANLRARWRIVCAGIAIAVTFALLTAGGCAKQPGGPERAESPDREQMQKLNLMDETAEEMYQLIRRGDVGEARSKLLALGSQVTHLRFEGVTSVEGLNAFTGLLSEAQKIYNAAQFSQEQGLIAAAKIRLAADALAHRDQPMWRQYGRVLLADLNRLTEALGRGEANQAAHAFGALSQHYEIVRPSLVISREPGEVEKTDSLLNALRQETEMPGMPSERTARLIDELHRTFGQMFGVKDALAPLPLAEPKQPIVWTLGIGTAIVAALSYVAWRMFGAERNIVTVHRKK
jgi:sporulation protein YpjB